MVIAKKRFGQNFLVDENIIQSIVRSLSAKPEDHFVEIGPGLAALTKPLLQQELKVDVIEIDRDLIGRLKKLSTQFPNFTIHQQDILEFNFSELVKDNKKLRIIGNLPYNISSPILLHCFEYINSIQDMTFMLQKEVVDRLVAEPNSKNYGRLSIITQYFCKAEKLFEVSPESFDPPPKVTSAVFRLVPKSDRQNIDIKKLELITQQAFGQRRKTLRNSLSKLFSAEQLLSFGIDPMRRAETLSLEEYCLLATHMK